MSGATKVSPKALKTVVKLKGIKADAGPSPVQREWIKKLGAIESPKPEQEPVRLGVTGTKEAFIGGLGDLIPDPTTSKIVVRNQTEFTLQLIPGSAKVERKPSKFSKAPGFEIAAKDEDEFAVTNKFLGPVPPVSGTGGEVAYDVVGAGEPTRVFLKWERGLVLPSRETPVRVDPPKGAKVKVSGSNNGGDDFLFVVKPVGGGGGVNPPPSALDIRSSCAITVNNKTGQELILTDQGHDRGDFMTLPGQTVPAGGSISFVSIETPNAKEQGCKGFLVWEVGSPMVAVWRIEWDNPEQQKNTTKTTVDPQTAGFRSLDQIGQGEENVPVVFTISGGGESPGTGPVTPKEETEFKPPTESKQPTLRKGDKSKDGWVEYLQALLNEKLGIKLEPDGNFGSSTHKAVLDFQKKFNLQVDGTVGNQTWAALREGAAEKPSTDGRKPHTFVEEGAEARWTVESEKANRYLKDADELNLGIDSVGDAKIDDFEATVRVTPPGAKAQVVKVKIGPAQERKLKAAAGSFHIVRLKNFRKTFKSADPKAKVTEYLIEAFLPQELGGDLYKGNVREV